MAKLIQINTKSDNRGSLSIIENNKDIPFDINRVFYIYNVPDRNIERGGHRHKKTRMALICLNGSCIIENNDGENSQKFVLDSADKCLLLLLSI